MSHKGLPFQTISIATCAIPRRDIYGFTLPGLSSIPAEDQRKSKEAALHKLTIQKSAWLRKLQTFRAKNENNISLYTQKKKFKFLIRKGIPPDLRAEIWYEFSGAKDRCNAMPPGYYDKLCKEENLKVFIYGMLEEARILFKEHNELKRGYGIISICRILSALCKHRPWIKLTSSLIKMTGFLYVVIGGGEKREEEMFWILDAIIDGILGIKTSKQMIIWPKLQKGILLNLIKYKNPKLYDHVSKLDGCWSEMIESWFSSLFCLSLPSEVIAHIWDCLICEGPKVLLRVSLMLLMKCQHTIIVACDGHQMANTIGCRLKRFHDSSELMQMAFKGIGSMRSSMIENEKNKVKEDIEEIYLKESHILKKLELI